MIDRQAPAADSVNPALSLRPSEPTQADANPFGLPPAPAGMEDIALSPSFLMELTLKVIHYADTPTTEHIARVMALPPKLIEALLDSLKADKLCEIVGGGSTYDLSTNYRFRLTEKGEIRAEQALERCRYAGAAPVTIRQYQKVAARQKQEIWRPSQEIIDRAFTQLIVDEEAVFLLSKALRSGRCAMVFGPSGNGKTHLLAEFMHHLEGEIIVPHSLYAYGQIIRIFDPTVHRRRDPEPAPPADGSDPSAKKPGKEELYDRRWVRIQRPGLIVGGELTPESLELGYDPVTKFYQAPKHMKAQGGVLLVDDFGRQRMSPAELLNRWIMALERGTDNLLLRTGESIEIPFDIRLLFSTNLDPSDLADGAFLRRIPYKVAMPAAGPRQFRAVLAQECRQAGVSTTDESLDAVVEFLAERCNHPLSGSLARDLVSIIVDNAEIAGVAPALSVDTTGLAYLQFTGSRPSDWQVPQQEAPAATPQPAAPAPPPSVPEMYARAPEVAVAEPALEVEQSAQAATPVQPTTPAFTLEPNRELVQPADEVAPAAPEETPEPSLADLAARLTSFEPTEESNR